MVHLRSMSSRSCLVHCSTTLYLAAAAEGVTTAAAGCLPLPLSLGFLVAGARGWYALGARWSGT